MTQVDPITLSTVWHYLNRAARETRDSMFWSARGYMISQLHDLATGVWDAETEAVAIPEGLPSRMISGGFQIKACFDAYNWQIYPGDVFLTNHPFQGGACHFPDWCITRPIYYKDELLFTTMASGHMLDSGGALPGSYFLAHDSIAEGVNIVPIRVVERGQTRDDVLHLLWSNTRLYDLVQADTITLMAGTKFLEGRLIELLDKYGKETVLACIEEMKNRSERAVRAEIEKMADGTYYGESGIDSDGIDFDVPVWIRCKVTIKGDEMIADFSESDKQVKGFCNCTYPTLFSNVMVTVFTYLGSALGDYHNQGSMRPIKIIAPEGVVVNAKPGTLVASAPSVPGVEIQEAMMVALNQALPQKAQAAWCRDYAPQIAGFDPRTRGQYYYWITFNCMGGAGATYGNDGYQSCHMLDCLGTSLKADVEEEMLRVPWRYIRQEWWTDSCGAGKWRGAPGICREIVNESGDINWTMGSSDGEVVTVAGALGGQSPPHNISYVTRGTERIDIHTKRFYYGQLGDIYTTVCSGGAGVGDPAERDPAAVREDVIDELVSGEMARNVYKVVLKPDNLEIDYEATQKLRGS